MQVLIGMFIGALLYYVFAERKKSSGMFTIDLSDPMNNEICGLTMYESLDDISLKKQIIIDVRLITGNSQK